MSSSSEGITAEKISCPSKECKKTFKNATALEFHIQVMHNMCNNNNTKVINASKYGGKEGKARKYFCPNMNCTHRSQDKDLLPFKTYQALRQHYFTHHAEKNLPCTKCHKKFAEASLRDKHERNCNIKFVCSCGIAYRGKRGFMSHLSLSKHECPSALKEYFMPKKLKRIQQKSNTVLFKKREEKGPVPILPKGGFRPMPSSMNNSFNHVSQGEYTGIKKISIKKSSSKILPKIDCLKYYVINSIHPSVVVPPVCVPNTSSNVTCISGLEASGVAFDTVSTALVSSGINCRDANRYPSQVDHASQSNAHNTKSALTSLTVQQHVAHDSSCQTEEFMAWLDTESAKCSSVEPVSSHISTQTLQDCSEMLVTNPGDEDHLNVLSNMTQTETQTDDDWLSILLQEPEMISAETLNAECQTLSNPLQISNFNDNSNNNCGQPQQHGQKTSSGAEALYVFDTILDDACNMQTQTSFIDVMADGATQTGLRAMSLISDNASVMLDFCNDNETQTDATKTCSVVNSAHTQTIFQCESVLFSDLLNMETQTDFCFSNNLELVAAETQTFAKV